MTAADGWPAAGAGATAPLLVTDLLAGAQDLAGRLDHALAGGQWLDAYLLAAGLAQLVEDRLHPDPLLLYRAASYLRGLPSRPARIAGRAAGLAGGVVRARPGSARHRLVRARHALGGLTAQLAWRVLEPGQHGGAPGSPGPGTRPAGAWLAPILAAVPALAGDVLRIPACFHGFDLHPDDVRWLATAFGRRYPAPGPPLCVVGVRTSGSYLAPLLGQALRAAGHRRVEMLTYRPGRPFLRWERATLAATARAGGMAVVIDDPPGSGTSLAAAARAAGRAGFADPAVVLVFPSFGGEAGVPAMLSRWPAVVQPWAQWSVHGRLDAGRVTRALTRLTGARVGELRPAREPAPVSERGHVRARFEARLAGGRDGGEARRQILVEGAGLGYFGRQSVAVAAALPGYVPRVYGFDDGLLYRDWLPPAAAEPGGGLAATIAEYVTARRKALPAGTATVELLGGRDPAWEVAARLLSGQYGPLAVPARPLLLEPVVRRLLRHNPGAVPDGKTGSRHWLPDPATGGLRKVDFYQRGFGHLDLVCYDPVFDLAGAAADPPCPGFEALLREDYRRATGCEVDGERWLLYRLAQLWRLGRAGDIPAGQVRRRSAAAVGDYLAAVYLRGLAPATGPLCAIDLDGVLECDRLGYPATSPTGMLAVRALIAHGYRPVLASGRSLADVADRCLAFGLAGGVAEYGAAIWVGGTEHDLRPPAARALLERVRGELAAHRDVAVDPRYSCAVRASTGGGPLPPELVHGIPALAAPGLRVIHGEGQTDIAPAGLDKGTGLAALAARLPGSPGPAPSPGPARSRCALAVGDSAPDLPMFADAALAQAPRNARRWAGAAGIAVSRHAYQSGLADACTLLLGHRPGGCPVCRPPALPARTRALLAVLDLRADGLASIPGRTAHLAALAIRPGKW